MKLRLILDAILIVTGNSLVVLPLGLTLDTAPFNIL